MKIFKPLFTAVVFSLGIAALPNLALATTNVDINKADISAFEKIKGFGPKKAQAIIDYRTQHGPFKSVDELTSVKGIGEKTLKRIEKQDVHLLVNPE